MDLTIVIPTYNEAQNLPLLVDALLNLKIHDVRSSIIIVDDNSPDGTGQIAMELKGIWGNRVNVIQQAGKMGLGSAYLRGFRAALDQGAELIAQMDADFSHDPAVLRAMLEKIETADLVIGSRYMPGGGIDRQWSWHRKALSIFANRFVIPVILGLKTCDATSGYRLWRRETLLGINPWHRVHTNNYAFQTEMALLAERLGFKISEVPIFFHERTKGASKMTLQVKIGTILTVIGLYWRYRRKISKG
jgi:dolichol-phosphate mannosyltransferase